MSKNNCDYLVRDGICGAHLEVCCVYQNGHKYPHNDQHWSEIHSLKECWCDYPNIAVPPDVEKAIRDIAEFVNGKKQSTTP